MKCLVLLCMLISIAAPACGLAQSQPAAPLEVERSIDLRFTRYADVLLPTMPASKQRIAVLGLASDTARDAAKPSSKPVAAGGLLWWVSVTGIRVSDRVGRLRASTPLLTSQAVRPQQIVEDTERGAVWLYGDALYRYRVATGELDRFAPSLSAGVAIRKLVPTASGVWLASDHGVLMFDDATEVFRTVPAAGTAPQVGAVLAGRTIWFAAEAPRLIGVTPGSAGHGTIAVSDPLPLGVAAEMHGIGDALWMLLGGKTGNAYRIACLDIRHSRLDVFRGSYFSLRRDGAVLIAGAPARLYTIDPLSRTAQARALDSIEISGVVIGTGVSFLGSSYSVKDPSEIVEQRPIDLSRGWSDPERQSAARH